MNSNKHDRLDLSFVTVNITDKDGNICLLANNMLKFSIEGPGEIAGLDNGCQTCLEPFKGNSHSAFHGKCLAIVKAKKGQSGTITLKVEAEGLQKAEIKID